MCVCVCHALSDFLLLILICSLCLYTIDLYNYGYLSIVFFFKVVKCFELPIIIIIDQKFLCVNLAGY